MEKNSSLRSLPPSSIDSSGSERLGAWTILAALGIIPVAIAGVSFGYLLIWAMYGRIDPHHIGVPALLTTQLFGYLFLAPYVLAVTTALLRRSLADLGFRTPSVGQIATALLGAGAMIIVVTSLAQVVQYAAHVHHEQQAVEIFRTIHDRGIALYFALVVAIAAPLVEELAFRIFIFNAVRRVASFWIAAPVSGALFALAHADPFLFIPLTAGGMILCYVYVRTGNAWMSMITHACFNGFTLVVLFAVPKGAF